MWWCLFVLDTFKLIYGIASHFGVSFNQDLWEQSDAMLVNEFAWRVQMFAEMCFFPFFSEMLLSVQIFLSYSLQLVT